MDAKKVVMGIEKMEEALKRIRRLEKQNLCGKNERTWDISAKMRNTRRN